MLFAHSLIMTFQSAEFDNIESKIYLIHGKKVMLDSDLAVLYQVETKNLNKAVNRNLERFPEDFMFQLTESETDSLRFQIGTSNEGRGGRRTRPYVFTQEGIAMLSGVLRSNRAVQVNIAIMRTFVKLREVLSSNRELEKKIIELDRKYDGKFKLVFDAIKELISNHSVPRKRIIGFEPPSSD